MASLFDHLDDPVPAPPQAAPAPLAAEDEPGPPPADGFWDLGFDFGFNQPEGPVSPAWQDDPGAPAGRPRAPVDPEHDPLLEGLTVPQREAVLHDTGPMIVTAGPGSGKTRVLTHRVAYLIARREVPPWAILAVTFTNKAAQEMRERIARLVERHDPAHQDRLRVRVSTFHSFCSAMLRRYGPPDRTRDFTIFDADDQKALLRRVLKALELDTSRYRVSSLLGQISAFKNCMTSASEVESAAVGFHDRVLAKVYARYEEELERFNALDFDDLQLSFVRLLDEAPEVKAELQRRFRYVLIDEYQDTNRPQYLIALRLAGPDGNLFVVGDVDQSIYRWRGADIRNLLDFERDHASTREVRLEQNFRSTKHVCACAQALIEHNVERREKTLFTENDEGAPVRVVRLPSDETEARLVGEEVEALLQAGTDPTEIAVFYRNNALSRRFEEDLRARGIRHTVIGAVPFYARREVKDALAYLRVLKNASDEPSLLRVIGLTEGIAGGSLEKVQAYAREQGLTTLEALAHGKEVGLRGRQRGAAAAVHALFETLKGLEDKAEVALRHVLDETGYLVTLQRSEDPQDWGRAENVQALVDGAKEFDRAFPQMGIRGFLDYTAMLSGTDLSEDEKRSSVKLMTLHSAKGLEFDHVYLAGLDEGLLPLERENEVADLEEERRLVYVGITRARLRLTLTTAAVRRTYGQDKLCRPSRFIAELPAEGLERLGLGTAHPARPSFEPAIESVARFRARRAAPDDAIDDGPPVDAVEGAPWTSPRPARSPRRAAAPLPGGLPLARETDPGPVRPGARVAHRVFGRGSVISVDGDGVRRRAKVRFDTHGVKTLVLQYAGLEPV